MVETRLRGVFKGQSHNSLGRRSEQIRMSLSPIGAMAPGSQWRCDLRLRWHMHAVGDRPDDGQRTKPRFGCRRNASSALMRSRTTAAPDKSTDKVRCGLHRCRGSNSCYPLPGLDGPRTLRLFLMLSRARERANSRRRSRLLFLNGAQHGSSMTILQEDDYYE